MCVLEVLREYLKRTLSYRRHDNLFISINSPHGPVSKDTLSRWLKFMLNEAKVDTSIFGAHSFRHAATSKAALCGTSTDVIFSRAGWSEKSSTFARFYNKPIDKRYTFAKSVLSGSV